MLERHLMFLHPIPGYIMAFRFLFWVCFYKLALFILS